MKPVVLDLGSQKGQELMCGLDRLKARFDICIRSTRGLHPPSIQISFPRIVEQIVHPGYGLLEWNLGAPDMHRKQIASYGISPILIWYRMYQIHG